MEEGKATFICGRQSIRNWKSDLIYGNELELGWMSVAAAPKTT
jgi:hypothetical protein